MGMRRMNHKRGLTRMRRRDATDAKRAGQASGAHPLQQSFKAAAGELLKKYGMAPDDAGGLVIQQSSHYERVTRNFAKGAAHLTACMSTPEVSLSLVSRSLLR